MERDTDRSEQVTFLQQRVRALIAKNDGLLHEVDRLSRVADSNWKDFIDAHNALNLLAQDANRVLHDHGADGLRKELQTEREAHEKLKAKRKQWMQFARQSVEMKAKLAKDVRERDEVIEQLRQRLTEVAQQRDEVERSAKKVIGDLEAKLARIAEQCELWHRSELDTMTTIAGITGEMRGFPLPEPGAWERAKAVRAAEILSQHREMSLQLGTIEDLLREEGIPLETTHANMVRVYINKMTMREGR